jgi:hypothetical protein
MGFWANPGNRIARIELQGGDGMESAFRWLLALLLTALLCAAYKPPPPTGPQRIGWKHFDGRRAAGPIVQQAETSCNKEATKSASVGVTLLMQLTILNSTLHNCMAKQGYLPLMQ